MDLKQANNVDKDEERNASFDRQLGVGVVIGCLMAAVWRERVLVRMSLYGVVYDAPYELDTDCGGSPSAPLHK